MTKNLISSLVIAESGIGFGTSGVRGLVTEFTPNVCAAFSIAFIQGLRANFSFTKVAIAIDNRPSSYAMAQACSAALQQLNVDVIYYGVIPTPALAYVSQEDQIPAIMVTGSHIPFDRNGLKFYRPDGEISKLDEEIILNADAKFLPLENVDSLNELSTDKHAEQEYIKRYTSLFDTQWLKGKRVGIYEHSSSGRDLYYQIFEALGAEVIPLARSNEFVPIDTEAVSEADKKKAISWSKEFSLDVVFSTDGDGDRPLVSDESGVWLRGDILGLITAKALSIESLAVPVNSNSAIELCGAFAQVKRTKIGSPYVIAEFNNLKNTYRSVAGFEANGGFLLGTDTFFDDHLLKSLPTRDAMLPVLMLLYEAQEKSISSMVASLPQRFTYSDRLQNFPTEKSKQILAKAKTNPKKFLIDLGLLNVEISNIDETDGFRITLSDERIIHFRPSGNAPELRCYAEAASDYVAKTCVDNCLISIENL